MRFTTRLLLTCSVAAMLAGCNSFTLENEKKSAHNDELSSRQEVKLHMAHASEESGDYAGAEALFQQVVSQAPNALQPRIELAEFYRRHHEDAKAVESLKTALKMQPVNTDIARNLANTYINAGEPEMAIPVLEQAIAINPKDPLLYNSKGVALDQMGNYSEAQNSYKTAYDIDPVGGTTYKVNISMSYILSGKYDKAIELLRPMLDAPESPPIVRQNLALAYGLKGESETALKLGLQDLSTSEAEENLKFYRMLAQRKGHMSKKAGAATIPAAEAKELFPDDTPMVQPTPHIEAAPASQTPPTAVTIPDEIPVAPKHVPKPTPKIVEMPESMPDAPAATNDSEPASQSPTEIMLPAPVLKPDQH